jgi:hypothetical protein
MPRKPVGTQIRSTPDWFDGNTAMAGGIARGAPGDGIQLSLYNDAPVGQYLYLYWAGIFNDAEGGFRFAAFEGLQGSLLQQGQYVMAGRAAAFGGVYFTDVPHNPGDFPANSTQYPGLGYLWDDDGIWYPLNMGGPITILPPGFSFAVLNEWGGGAGQGPTLACTFYYTILPFIPNQ